MKTAALVDLLESARAGYWGVDAGKADVDVPIIRNGDIKEDGVRWQTLPIRGLTTQEAARCEVRTGDVLITTSGEPGQVARVAGEPSTRTCASNFVRVLRFDPGVVDPRYAFRFLSTTQFRLALAPYIRGTTLKNLSTRNAFASVRVPLPSLPEQHRIASILEDADELRTKRHQILAHLETLAPALFHQMFGDPIANDRGWPLKRLADLGTLDRGVSRHRPRNDPTLLGGAYPLIQTGDVAKSGGFVTRYTATYSDLGLRQSRLWPKGTLCITIAANIAKTGILTFDACFPDSVVGFTSDADTTVFVQVWLGFLQATLEASAPQSAQKNINLAVLRDLKIPVPAPDALAAFAARVALVNQQRAKVEQALHATNDFFATLQSRAFRGDL